MAWVWCTKHRTPGWVTLWHYQYHAVPGNIRRLSTFRQRINRLRYQAPARGGQRARKGGRLSLGCSNGGYRARKSCTLILKLASTPLILYESRMRKRARTDLRRGRSAMVVPTATT